jgi:tripartite ATP-independent transporter DctP family solute receptor
MRKILMFVALTALVIGGAFASGQAEPTEAPEAEAEQIVLRLAETHPQDYPTTQGNYYFAELVEERTDGRITIEVYPSSQLGEERAVIEQVQFGAIDMTRVSISPLAAFSPGLDALQMPYLYNSVDHMWRVLKGPIGDEMLASVEDAGFVGLAWYESGARSFYNSVRPIESVEDLAGLKIRVQESQLMVGLVEALGAVATPMPYGEVYGGLQTGVIDGAENNWPSYYSSSHYEVAQYYTLDRHTQVPEILIASKITMDRLSAADQEIIRQAAKDSIDYQREQWAAFVAESEEAIRANGNVITELSPSALALARRPFWSTT